MSYHLHAVLARERTNTLAAEAEGFRLAKPARTHQPTARDTDQPTGRWRPRWQSVQRAVPSTQKSA